MLDASEVSFTRYTHSDTTLGFFTDFFKFRLGLFAAKHNLYLLPTREMVESLGRHLRDTLSSLPPERRGSPILDLGGGTGRLAYWLNTIGNVPAQVVPVDVVPPSNPMVEVIVMDQQEAVEKYQPSIVLASWMPSELDWTKGWRHVPSVR